MLVQASIFFGSAQVVLETFRFPHVFGRRLERLGHTDCVSLFEGYVVSIQSAVRRRSFLLGPAVVHHTRLCAANRFLRSGWESSLADDFEGLRPRIPTIWTTHPDPEERAAVSRAAVADLPRRERDPSEYDGTIYPLRAMTLRDYIQADYPYTAIVLAQRLLERYPNDPEFRLLLGDAWRILGPRSEFAPEDLSNREKWRNIRRRTRRTREERAQTLLETSEGRQAFEINLGHARSEYQKIIDSDANYAPAYRGIGEVHEALEQSREAAKFYLEYLRRAPDGSDRSVIISRLSAIRDRIQ